MFTKRHLTRLWTFIMMCVIVSYDGFYVLSKSPLFASPESCIRRQSFPLSKET